MFDNNCSTANQVPAELNYESLMKAMAVLRQGPEPEIASILMKEKDAKQIGERLRTSCPIIFTHIQPRAPIATVYGIKIVYDETLPPDVLCRMLDKHSNIVHELRK